MRFNFNSVISMISCVALVNAKLIMIIRHGEKLNDEVTNLSPRGEARAHCLIDVFGNNGSYATPQVILAQNPTEKKQSTRPRDTVVPLAESLGLNVDLSFTSNQVKKLAKFVNESPSEVFLISWSNDKIPDIAEKLGITNPPDWDNDVFDDIWMIYDSSSASYLNNNAVVKRAAYSGEGYTMEIVKQNVDECISKNIQNYSSNVSDNDSNNANVTSGANHLNSSILMMIVGLFAYVLITLY